MTKNRLDGIYLLLLGCVVFLLLGAAMENAAKFPLTDFKAIYYPAQTLLQHADPYLQRDVLRVYRAEGGDSLSDTAINRQIATQNQYLPTVFSFSAPFALLPWGPAHLVWLAFSFASLILASVLVWSLGADYSPVLAGALVGLLLANSEVIVLTGNIAGIAISLCAVAVWCFLRDRFVPLGILCLAVSLAVKPHDVGFIWLYFVLAGGIYRRRALQTLGATVALSLPGVLWVWLVSPNWMQELRANILAYSVHGGANDPGPASSGAHGLDRIISLQSVISVFRDDPRFYNPAVYLLCAPILLIWVFAILRSRPSPRRAWLALAAISAFTMLPVYHRQLDAKLLLLTVPACAMLWSEGRPIGRFAVLISTAAFVLTGDLPWALFFSMIGRLRAIAPWLSEGMLTALVVFPVPTILLVTCAFYLWIQASRWEAQDDKGQA
jgi:hypothetical protein